MAICEGKTFKFGNASISEWASVVGKVEGEGPHGDEFDEVLEDNKDNMDTWEQAEAQLQKKALQHAMDKAKLCPEKNGSDIRGRPAQSVYRLVLRAEGLLYPVSGSVRRLLDVRGVPAAVGLYGQRGIC